MRQTSMVIYDAHGVFELEDPAVLALIAAGEEEPQNYMCYPTNAVCVPPNVVCEGSNGLCEGSNLVCPDL
jgi:hypothetical protein